MKEFCKTYGITEDQFYGRDPIRGDLDLRSITEIPEGFNPTVGCWLNLRSVTKIPKGFQPTVGGFLYLDSLKEIPEGFNPTVGGLNLSSVTDIPKGFNPTVGGSLYLRSVKEIPKGFNPTVGGWLDLSAVTKIPKGFNPTVGRYLYLNSVTKIPKGFNPTLGGSLNLWSVKEIPEGFNPTVGGNLYLRSITEIPKGFNPTVGGSLHLGKGLTCKHTKLPVNHLFSWADGKYIQADGIFTEVVSKRGNIYKVKKIGKTEVTYLITDGNGKYSHGDTIKEARDSLIYKISDRDTSKYQGLNLKSKLSFEEAIACYRVITGACEAGTRGFIKTHMPKPKKSYTVAEIINITTGSFGNETFSSFWSALGGSL